MPPEGPIGEDGTERLGAGATSTGDCHRGEPEGEARNAATHVWTEEQLQRAEEAVKRLDAALRKTQISAELDTDVKNLKSFFESVSKR